MIEDLRWFGLEWDEGPDCGGPYGPYRQSERLERYQGAFESLRAAGAIYPCVCSRQDVMRALGAPHSGDDEPVYPGTCRPPAGIGGARDQLLVERSSGTAGGWAGSATAATMPPAKVNWRFRVPDGEAVEFVDGAAGAQRFVAGRDFGDFVVWRHDGVPSYQLAVVVDDCAMEITEVVRGADLLRSTARQLLLCRALGFRAPVFHHCPLLRDAQGLRLAKRHDALSLRALRAGGARPEELQAGWGV
jgi:glutamyl-tRNA synthetase